MPSGHCDELTARCSNCRFGTLISLCHNPSPASSAPARSKLSSVISSFDLSSIPSLRVPEKPVKFAEFQIYRWNSFGQSHGNYGTSLPHLLCNHEARWFCRGRPDEATALIQPVASRIYRTAKENSNQILQKRMQHRKSLCAVALGNEGYI